MQCCCQRSRFALAELVLDDRLGAAATVCAADGDEATNDGNVLEEVDKLVLVHVATGGDRPVHDGSDRHDDAKEHPRAAVHATRDQGKATWQPHTGRVRTFMQAKAGQKNMREWM